MTTTPRFIPDTLTPCTPQQVFNAIAQAWQTKFNCTPSRASMLTLLSQWAEEDGIGRDIHCFNLGNAKCAPNGTHAWTYFECGETINGHDRRYYPPDPACCFRAFDTLEDGAADYLDMMFGRFHSAWQAVLDGNPAEFAQLLKVAKYYTAPESKYETALVSLFHELDRMVGAADEPAQGMLWVWVQTQLNAAGVKPYTLKIDGIPGTQTRADLSSFQQVNGLLITGAADDATVTALRTV